MQAIGVMAADRAARLQGGNHDAVVDQLQLDDMGRAGNRRAHRVLIAFLKAVGEIVRCLLPQWRRIGLQRHWCIDHRRQRLPVDAHQFGGIARGNAGFRDHERHRITDMTRAIGCQREARRHDHRRDACHRNGAGQRPRSARSVAVKIPRTPGMRVPPRCRCVRSRRARAANARPASTPDPESISSMKRPRPVRKRASSSRRSDWPMKVTVPACRRCRSPAPGPAASSRWRPPRECRSCAGPARGGIRSRRDTGLR